MSPGDAPNEALSSSELLLRFVENERPRCPICDYELAGLRSVQCPECGLALTLRVGAAAPRSGLWFAVLGGLTLTIGGFVFVLLIVLWTYTFGDPASRPASGRYLSEWIFPIATISAGVFTLWLLASRRGRLWFHVIPRWRATTLAIVGVLAPLITFGLWLLLIILKM